MRTLLIIVFGVCLMALGAIMQCIYTLYTREDTPKTPVECNSCTAYSNRLLGLIDSISNLREENDSLREIIISLKKENDRLRAIVPPTKEELDSIIKSNATINQGMSPKQLRNTIKSVLTYLGEKHTSKWTDLLMITCQAESDLGRLTKQSRGPAVGIFQIEPTTEQEVWKHFINKNKNLKSKITSLRFSAKLSGHELEYNTAYSVALAYSIYKWRGVNPANMDTIQLIKTHKIKYNTVKGKATVTSIISKIKGSNIL